MTIKLFRISKTPTEIIGVIVIDNEMICMTLERPDVAIPDGNYPLVYEYSPKFKRDLWELKNVPKRSEIKIHIGNYTNETDGCILIGFDVKKDKEKSSLMKSEKALEYLHKKLPINQVHEIQIKSID